MQLGARTAAWLPYDAEVEYLESTGTQYIDTGIVSQNNLVYDFTFQMTARARMTVFGFKEGTSWKSAGMNDAHFMHDGTNNGGYFDFANTETGYDLLESYDNINTFHFDFTDGNARFEFNGDTIITLTGKTGTYDGTKTVFAFWCNSMGNKSKGRIYNFSVSKNGVKLFDSLPVRFTNENGVSEGAMYDRANPTGGPLGNGLYRNSGTGAFTIGPVKT